MKSDPKWWPAAGTQLLQTHIRKYVFRWWDILWALQDIITQSKLIALILDRKQTAVLRVSERSSATTQCAAASCWLGIKSTQSSTGGLLALLISAGLSSWQWLALTDTVLCISWSCWDCRQNKSSINNNCQSSQRGASTSIQRATNALLFLKCCMTYPFCRTSLSADPSLVNLNFSVSPPPIPPSQILTRWECDSEINFSHK